MGSGFVGEVCDHYFRCRLIGAEKSLDGKARRICDHLAGLTDGMIVRTYRRLFDPEFGSIRDLS